MFKSITSYLFGSKPTISEGFGPDGKPYVRADGHVYFHKNTMDCSFMGWKRAAVDPKRIIIACDGTWQDSNNLEHAVCSNVTRLCFSLKPWDIDRVTKKQVRQVVYYQAGVGTTWLQLDRLLGGGMGIGLEENVREAYSFIANNYDTGDEIYIFGFSRGAYTARSLAGLINEIGLLRKESLHVFPEVYKQYKAYANPEERKVNLRRYLYNELYPKHALYLHVPIKVVGCWDTVGSLGVPDGALTRYFGWNNKYKFHNTALAYGIENAFHALALDERRKTFSPTLWYLPPVRTGGLRRTDSDHYDPNAPHYWHPTKSREHAESWAPEPTLRQCWFPGVHIDIGGGSTAETFPELSNLSFLWMVDQVKPFLTFDEDIIKRIKEEIDGRYVAKCFQDGLKAGWFKHIKIDGPLHPQNKELSSVPDYAALLRRGFQWASVEHSKWSLKSVTHWLGQRCRTPVFYHLIPRMGDITMIDGLSSTEGWTNEVIHPIVRLQKSLPLALKQLNAKPGANYNYWTLSQGNAVMAIKEYTAPTDTVERILYNDDEYNALYGPHRVPDASINTGGHHGNESTENLVDVEDSH